MSRLFCSNFRSYDSISFFCYSISRHASRNSFYSLAFSFFSLNLGTVVLYIVAGLRCSHLPFYEVHVVAQHGLLQDLKLLDVLLALFDQKLEVLLLIVHFNNNTSDNSTQSLKSKLGEFLPNGMQVYLVLSFVDL